MKRILHPPFSVTLLISTYNRPEALEPVLRSALQQTILPSEIVIADDGSGEDTRKLIERITESSPVPIMHVWHDDIGFRLSEIRNKGIIAANGEYIIQIDGDVILERHFIADHIGMAEIGWFVCGSRLLLNSEITQKVIDSGMRQCYSLTSNFDYILNNLRIGWLRRYMAKRFAQNSPARLRGCNMAFWKSDLIAVNGYNEDMAGWGGEDIDIAFRLIFNGVGKKMLKFGAVMYHLYHTLASKDLVERHGQLIEEVKRELGTWCENGIDKHLSQK